VRSPIRRAVDGAVFALTFLTVIPLPTRDGRGAAEAPAWFGAVGALIGAVAGGVYAVAQPVLGSAVAAALAATATVAVTGGLHHDGLADCADGMGVRGDAQRRLSVMREPTIGAFGALALLLWGLLLTTALAALSPGDAVWALVCAATAARLAALLHARWAAPARRDGLGAAFAPSWPGVLATGATTIAIAIIGLPERTFAVLLVTGLSALAVSAWARRFVGGRTGDTLGATVVITEVVVVLVLLGSVQAP
jgi:adenosylcobinamide-GDP ribazoletransferase